MKTKTGVSLSEVAVDLLSIVSEHFGISRSSAIEIVVRYYAEHHGYCNTIKQESE